MRRRWQRAVVFVYPLATLFCIVVTANHYWIDALGGLVILGAGYLSGRALAAYWDTRAESAAGRPRAAAPA